MKSIISALTLVVLSALNPPAALASEDVITIDNGDPMATDVVGTWRTYNPSRISNWYGEVPQIYDYPAGDRRPYSFYIQLNGTYDIAMWWPVGYVQLQSEALVVKIFDDGTLIDTINVDQTQYPVHNYFEGEHNYEAGWTVIGQYQFQGEARVTLESHDYMNSYADAVQFRKLPAIVGEIAATKNPALTSEVINFNTSEIIATLPAAQIASVEWDWNADGQFDSSGTSAQHQYAISGEYVVSAKITTNQGDEQLFTLTVFVNETETTPTIVNTPPEFAEAQQQWEFTPEVTDPDMGDGISFLLTGESGGVELDPETGRLSWQTTVGDIGSYNFELSAVDNRGLTHTLPIQLEVLPINECIIREKIIDNWDVPFVPATGHWKKTNPNYISDWYGDIPRGRAYPDPDHSPRPFTVSYPTTRLVDIAMWWPEGQFNSDHVPVEVHDGDTLIDTLVLDQTENTAQWVTIGRYQFSGEANVTLRSVDIEASFFDAARFTTVKGTHCNGLTAVINVMPEVIIAGQYATLDGSSSATNVAGASIIDWQWDIDGDGVVDANGETVQHVFTEPGSYTVHLTVTDDQDPQETATAEKLVVVEPAFHAPEFTFEPSSTADQSELYRVQVTFIDPDVNDTHTLALEASPEYMSLDTDTNELLWYPQAEDTGSREVLIKVTDNTDLSDTKRFTIAINDTNDAPYFISEPVTSIKIDETYSYQSAATDPDNDTLVYDIVWGPTELQIDTTTGLLTWPVTIDDLGEHEVTIVTTDPSGASATQKFVIFVTEDNLPPEIVSPAVISVAENAEYLYDVEATDPNVNDPLSYHLLASPGEMAIDTDSGLISWVPGAEWILPAIPNATQCRQLPEVSSSKFSIDLEWRKFGHYENTPLVAKLFDTNASGSVDEGDESQIVSSLGLRDTLESHPVAIHATSKNDIQIYDDPAHRLGWGNSTAVADIDNDGSPEIIGVRKNGGIVAYNANGTVKWAVTPNEGAPNWITEQSMPAIADINDDGFAEIIHSRFVYSHDGQLLWEGTGSFSGKFIFDIGGGKTSAMGLAMDVHPDYPGAEVIVGASLYSSTGELIWEKPEVGDGHAAVADIDSDGAAELIVIGHSVMHALNYDGSVEWGPISLGAARGGLPAIADVNGDGNLEIAVAAVNKYLLFNNSGVLLWSKNTRDGSGVTGSTVFDFEGDGKSEIVYADERTLYIWDGAGEVKLDIVHGSTTGTEYPVIADIDQDNRAELLIGGSSHIELYNELEDRWVSTRQIWNQYPYYISAINDDMTVTGSGNVNWSTHNTFLLNTFLDQDPLGIPDLYVHELVVTGNSLSAVIANTGSAPANESRIQFFSEKNGELALLGDQVVSAIETGNTIEIEQPIVAEDLVDVSAIIAIVDPQDTTNECLESNNQIQVPVITVRAIDSQGLYDDQIFSINVENVNDAPTIVTNNLPHALLSSIYKQKIIAQDPDFGDTLTYSLSSVRSDISIDSETGLITWHVPSSLIDSSVSVNVEVTDMAGLIDQKTYILEINLPPEFVTQPVVVATQDDSYNYASLAVDPQGETVQYRINGHPLHKGLNIDNETGSILWYVSEKWGPQDGSNECGARSNIVDRTTEYEFNGSALLLNENSEDPLILRVTPSEYKVAGSVFTGETTSVLDEITMNGAFSTYFTYQISDKVAAPDSDGADGFAFVLTSSDVHLAGNGGSIGYFSTEGQGIPESVAIEFDTFLNEINSDVSHNHIALNVSGNAPSISTAESLVDINSGDTHHVWIDYNPQSQVLEVRQSTTERRPDAATLSQAINLSNYVDLERVYVGFTGATGGAYQAQDISNWQFSPEYNPMLASVDIAIDSFSLVEENGQWLLSYAVLNQGSVLSEEATLVVRSLSELEVEADLITLNIPQLLPGERYSATVQLAEINSDVAEIYGELSMTDTSLDCELKNNTVRLPVLRVTAFDPFGLQDRQVFVLNVENKNDAPTAEVTTSLKITAGSSLNRIVPAYDNDTGAVLEYHIISGPDGLNINSATGKLSWSPTLDDLGEHNVVLAISDEHGATTQIDLRVEIEGDTSPEIITLPITSTVVDEGYSYDVDAIDLDNDIINYELAQYPTGMVINESTGVINWSPDASFVSGVPRSPIECTTAPLVLQDLIPVEKWNWDGSLDFPASNQVLSVPVVVQATDDNGDGLINELDDTDIAFISTESTLYQRGVFRIVDGATGIEHVAVEGDDFQLNDFPAISAADINNDGKVEFIIPRKTSGLIALSNTGEFLWENINPQVPANRNTGAAYIFDLEGDGDVEILYGKALIDHEGQTIRELLPTYWGSNVSLSAYHAPVGIAADIDLDGEMEIIAGASVAENDLSLKWKDPLVSGGYAAIANFNATPEPEIVVVARGKVFMYDYNGNRLWGVPGNIQSRGGAPAIGELDGDPSTPEIIVAGSYKLYALRADGSELWSIDTDDTSSGVTGATVFDLDGDGVVEVLYNDHDHFYILDGPTGEPVHVVDNSTTTWIEYPIIADVDNDGKSEIVLISNTIRSGTNHGIRVLDTAAGGWLPTRRIWNQHAYSIDNINDDLTVPTNPVKGWLTHNSYRLNTFPDRDPLSVGDLVISNVALVNGSLEIVVGNGGAAPITTEVSLRIFQGDLSSGTVIDTLTIAPLGIGETATYSVLAPTDISSASQLSALIDITNAVEECDETNNEITVPVVTIRATDDDQNFDQQTFTINIVAENSTPEFTSEPNTAVVENNDYLYQATAFDANLTDALTFELTSFPVGMTIDSSSGLISWNSADVILGSYQVEVVVSDPFAASDTQLFTLEVINQNDSPVITNDAPELVDQNQPYIHTVTATDPDIGDVLRFSLSHNIVNNEANKPTINAETGEITWTPNQANVGTAELVIVVRDRVGASDSRTVLVEVTNINDAPVFTNTARAAVVSSQSYLYIPEASDPDGDSYSFSVVSAPNGFQFANNQYTWSPTTNDVGYHDVTLRVTDVHGAYTDQSFVLEVLLENLPPNFNSEPPVQVNERDVYSYPIVVSDPESQVVELTLIAAPSGVTLDPVNKQINWSTTSSDIGTHSFTIRATDQVGAYVEQSFTVVVNNINEAPQITSIPQYQVDEGAEYSYIARAVDPDVGDLVSFNLESGPAGLVIDVFGQMTWSPSQADVGTHLIVIRATDIGGLFDEQSYLLTVSDINTAPRITSQPTTNVQATRVYQYQITAEDDDPADSISYALLDGPSTATVDLLRGLLFWQPTESDIGTVEFSVTATDTAGLTDTQTFNVVVGEYIDNQPPAVAIGASPESIAPNEQSVITVSATDDAGVESLTVTLDGSAIALDENNQYTFTQNMPGQYLFSATAQDAAGNIAEAATFVRITDPNDNSAPVVVITSPEALAEVTAPTPIVGTVNDDNLAQYTVAISSAGQNEFRTIFTGYNNVEDAELSIFDPTMLQNGLYDVRVTAEDVNGQTARDQITLTVDGDFKVGNFSFTVLDMEVPVSGIPIRVTRTYDTRRRHENLDFGYGWSIGYQDVKIEESRVPGKDWALVTNRFGNDANGVRLGWQFCVEPLGEPTVAITLPNGQVEKFKVVAENGCNYYYPVTDVRLAFDSLEGSTATLKLQVSPLLRLNGNRLEFLGEGLPYNPDKYILTTQEGYKYHLDQAFGIQHVVDPNGHTISFTDNGIIHSGGRSILFDRDNQGRIKRIVDPEGHDLHYTYDINGDLANVVDQVDVQTSYSYSPQHPHAMLEIFNAAGERPIKNIYDDDGRLVGQEDGFGNVTTFDHNLNDRQSVVFDRLNRMSIYEYDDEGNVLSVVNPELETTTYAYNDNGDLIETVDGTQRVITATYDDKHNQLTQTDGENNTTAYAYNHRGQTETITDAIQYAIDPSVSTYVFDYDGIGNLLAIDGPDQSRSAQNINVEGHVELRQDVLEQDTLFTYYDSGDVHTEEDPEGNVTTYTYDTNGNKLSEEISRTVNGVVVNETTSYVYDARNRVTKVTYPDGKFESIKYDPITGQEIERTDRRGNTTKFAYDMYGRLTLTTYPDLSTESREYDVEGNLRFVTNRRGFKTEYVYDGADRQVKVIHPDLSESVTVYDDAGRVEKEIDENGKEAHFEYDLAGRLSKQITHDGDETEYRYDANGNLILMIDANDHITRYTYNDLGHRTDTEYFIGDVNEFNLDTAGVPIETVEDVTDALGQLTTQIDESQRHTDYGYDKLGRLVTVTDHLDQETHYRYDEVGNKLEQEDANGHITKWTYDSLGRVKSRELPLNMKENYEYDNNGNMTKHIDFNRDVTLYRYNELDQLTEKEYQDGFIETYQYDANGNLTHTTDRRGTTINEYDNRDRLIKVTNPDGSTLEYGYDAASNRTSVTTTLATGLPSTVTYTYDNLNRLETVTDPDTGTTTYTYDAVGNRATVTLPNGNITTYTYDERNRLKVQETRNSASELIEQYTYDLYPTGRRQKVTELDGRTVEYIYDDLYRLDVETITNPDGITIVNEYDYDAVGNITYSIEDGVHTQYTYDDNDRLLTAGGQAFTYDLNGNTETVTEDANVTTNTYDQDNRLISTQIVESGVLVDDISYEYDAGGIRQKKIVNGVETNFLVDQNRSYAQVLVEYTDLNQELAFYVHGDDLLSITKFDELGNGDKRYYQHDGMTSVRHLSDGTGSITDSYSYAAYGTVLSEAGDFENPMKMHGEYVDEETGNVYLRARYYSPSIKRFTQQDSFLGFERTPLSLNKYAFTEGDGGINTIDPSGQFLVGSLIGLSINSVERAYVVGAGFSALVAIGAGLIDAGVIQPGDRDNHEEDLLLPAALLMLSIEISRSRLKAAVAEKNKGKKALFHYTSQQDAREIQSDGCILAAHPFKHPVDRMDRPSGAYATDIEPWIEGLKQKALEPFLYAFPRRRDLSWFVAVNNSGFQQIGKTREFYKKGKVGRCVPVDVLLIGPNLMGL